MSLFDPGPSTCPPLTQDMIAAVEKTLGYKLPESYLSALREHNGGSLAKNLFPIPGPASGAQDYVEVRTLMGIGGADGPDYGAIDSESGSQYLIEEWGYPDNGVIISCEGEVAVMLDYSECGPQGEPRVVYVDVEPEETVTVLAADFAAFAAGLVSEEGSP